MQDWQKILSSSIVSINELPTHLKSQDNDLLSVEQTYPMRINPYFLSLIHHLDDPIGKQVIPNSLEIKDLQTDNDPLDETNQSPTPGLIHRYPDRVVFLVSGECAVYCRFCMRKRLVGKTALSDHAFEKGIHYIQTHSHIRDVILSGGDPLLLSDNKLVKILSAIKHINHVEMIRIHTRTPSALPQRITRELITILKSFHPLFINIHFNHPNEITDLSAAACIALADAGIPLGSQTVLLKGVNDDPQVMTHLMCQLVKLRIKPYYIHIVDPVSGVSHFRTSLETGIHIINKLRGHISGLCVPHMMLDLPGGGGKVPIGLAYIDKQQGGWQIKNYQGKNYTYQDIYND